MIVNCSVCNKEIERWPYQINDDKDYLCSPYCRKEWLKNKTGEKGFNWKGGTWNNRVQYLAHTSYRTWRKQILNNSECILCGSKIQLELHHIELKILNPSRIKDESNVCPICSNCHNILHSKSSKGGELRETLSAILAYDNPQLSLPNVLIFVGRKVHRLIGEDIQSNKPDTSAAPERDDIVGTPEKFGEANV